MRLKLALRLYYERFKAHRRGIPFVVLGEGLSVSEWAGAGEFHVARMLGDTVERHYAPFVPVLRERVRRLMESGGGIESTSVGANSPHSPTKPPQIQ